MDDSLKQDILSMGKGTYGSPEIRAFEGDKGTVNIGNYCSLAKGIVIFVGGSQEPTHNMSYVSTFPFKTIYGWDEKVNIKPEKKSGVKIGNDVWIGEDVLILAGVTIGDGAVIGARSVVASNIPDYAIAVGNPCRVVKYRFDEEVRKLLLELKWWEWDIEKIRKEFEFIYSPCSADKIRNMLEKNKGIDELKVDLSS